MVKTFDFAVSKILNAEPTLLGKMIEARFCKISIEWCGGGGDSQPQR